VSERFVDIQRGEHGVHGESVTLLAEPVTDRVIGLATEAHRHADLGLLEAVLWPPDPRCQSTTTRARAAAFVTHDRQPCPVI
jgi:hypothetical protein